MTKTYTGFEALKRMMDGWIQKEKTPFNIYRFEDGVVKAKSILNGKYINTTININLFFNNTFVDYVEPLVAGDIVKITTPHGAFVFGTIDRANYSGPKAIITVHGSDAPHYADRAVRITEEEFKVEQRKEMFRAVGRAVDELHKGDIVTFKVAGYEYKAEVMQQGLGKDKLVEFRTAYSGLVPTRDITPVKFVTYVDATAPALIKVEPPVVPCNGQAPIHPMGGQF